MPRWSRFPGRFAIILLLAAAVFLSLEAINGRLWLNDFRVYYEAARALLNGEPLYGVAHGLSSGFFKYAPVLAAMYVPLALLPYPLAAGIQFALIVFAFIGSVILADRIIRRHVLQGRPESYAPLFLTTLVAGAHLHRELHLGNINALLLYVLLGGLNALVIGRQRLAGLLFGAAILAKPHFIILLPWLLLRWRTKTIGWVMITLLIGLIAPMALLGPAGSIELHREWLHAMAGHNASMVYTGGDAYQMVDTAYSFAHRALFQHLGDFGETATVLIVLGIVAAVFGLLVLRAMRRESTEAGRASHMVQEAFLLFALVPSLTVTDTNHFLFAAPLVLLVLHRLLSTDKPVWLAFAAIPMLLTHGGNWSDVLGPLSDRMTHYGILGIANLGLVIVGALLLKGLNHQQPSKSHA
ncbi:MAG: DUF2029 domain-containing protein [Flavobacteriales bacterium]|nr:DUF2029 domain-containing protein [Flavobacteriales bacterium]